MPAATEKRSRSPNSGESRFQKRRKVAKGAKRAKSKIDSLGWRSVPLPDRLDDYEGFFGLEEVDDVRVVKDSASGSVSFLSATGEEPHSDEPESANHAIGAENSKSGELEWEGFDDDLAGSHSGSDIQDRHTSAAKDSAPTREHSLSRKPRKTPQGPIESTGGAQMAFASLGKGESNLSEDSDVDITAWQPLKLSPDTLASLAKLKFASPTAIQKQTIPAILAGHDLIGKASTGSGKTLSYGIPILERFLETRNASARPLGTAPLALILSPTRELAHQITNHLKALCNTGVFEGPQIATLTGGLSIQKQQRMLKDADIVVGTPGRLWEVVSSGQGTLTSIKKVQMLVIDEADRLLSEGHFKEVEEILSALDKAEAEEEYAADEQQPSFSVDVQRQTLVFSATFDRGLQRKLAGGKPTRAENNLLNNKDSVQYLLSKLNFRDSEPTFVDVNPIKQMATGLKEGLVECPAGTDKDLYLYSTLLLNAHARTLVFTNSIAAVRRLVPFLQNLDMPAMALHSGMPQKARLRSVERFSDIQKPSILVATDVAARGLDIQHVQLVVHYHLPRQADMYVHRSGRTARAGNVGSSILICAPEEVGGVRRLIAKVHAQSALQRGQGMSEAARQGFYIRTLDIDRKVVTRLRPRASLAKKIADTQIAQERGKKEDDFLRNAAEELGVDYSSDEFEKQGAKGKRGRGAGRAKKDKEARGLTKGQVSELRAELKAMLKERVNVGVSEKYITAGRLDVDELLRQQKQGEKGDFLGSVDALGLYE